MAVSPTEITRSQANHLALQLVSARIGAAFDVVWGVLHLIAARGICELASSIPDGPAHARLEQGGLNLGLFAVHTMAVAVLLNWRNNRIGFWLNIIVIGAVDIGYVMLLIVPGYFPASFVAGCQADRHYTRYSDGCVRHGCVRRSSSSRVLPTSITRSRGWVSVPTIF